MATEICPNEGKDWIANNPVAGATVYAFLLAGVTIEGGDIEAITDLSAIDDFEESGTGYARLPLTMGASTNGIMAIPAVQWDSGLASDWQPDCQAWGIATHATAGVALFYWDLSVSRNMSNPDSILTIPTLDFFLMNPGEA